MSERWPPVYDADDLRATIDALAVRADQGSLLYSRSALSEGGPICQGDVVRLREPIPVPLIDAEGQPGLFGEEITSWLVIGNTCDFHRSLEEVESTQMVPILTFARRALSNPQLEALRGWRTSRRVYLPPWAPESDEVHIAELKWTVSVHKSALLRHARVVSRMSREGWILLHACLIRFLCRDDGRFDPG